MFNLSDYLRKFRRIVNDQEEQVGVVCLVLSEVVGVQISSNKVKISNGVVFVDTRHAVKNSIFLHKKEVLSLLSTKGMNISDIR